jgi:hypothetical protein
MLLLRFFVAKYAAQNQELAADLRNRWRRDLMWLVGRIKGPTADQTENCHSVCQ